MSLFQHPEHVTCSICSIETKDPSVYNSKPYCAYCYNYALFYECGSCHSRHVEQEVPYKLDKFSRKICNNCLNKSYFECTGCNCAYEETELAMNEYTGESINNTCQDCYCRDSIMDVGLNDWNYNPDATFYGTDRFYGIELEVDDGGVSKKIFQSLRDIANADNEFIYFKKDGSLENGFEIVSHPCDILHHRNIINWDGVFKTLLENGFTGHNNYTSGLHLHFDKSAFGSSIELYRFIYFFKYFWNDIKRFSRRKRDEIDEYTKNVDEIIYGIDEDRIFNNSMSKEAQSSILNVMRTNQFEKYFAVNMLHANTIEVRIFKSTLNMSVFMASIELTDAMINLAKDVNVDFRGMTWIEFVEKYCSKYDNLMLYMSRIMPKLFSVNQ